MSLLFRYCLAACLVFCCHIQSNGQKKPEDASFPTVTIRTNPLSLLEADGNIMLGVGLRINERWGGMVDAGYLVWRPYAERNEAEKETLSGIKIRADIRYFLNSYNSRVHIFIGPEFHFKHSFYNQWDDFGFNCIGGNCDYYRRASYNIEKREIGGAVKFGMIFPMGSRLSGEVFAGIGAKSKKYRLSNIPPGGLFINTPEYDDIPVIADTGIDGEVPSSDFINHILVPFGLKFAYRIR